MTTSAGTTPVVATDKYAYQLPRLLAVNGSSTWQATSTSSQLGGPVETSSGLFYGSIATLTGDVNGDGYPDLIAINTDSIWVMPGTATGFAAPVEWSSTPCYGTVATFIGDVNRDGMADVIAVNQSSTWVSTSTGAGFFCRRGCGQPRRSMAPRQPLLRTPSVMG